MSPVFPLSLIIGEPPAQGEVQAVLDAGNAVLAAIQL